jgi:hypothetical protein
MNFNFKNLANKFIITDAHINNIILTSIRFVNESSYFISH